MKILFNNTIFFNQRFGGISRYFVNLGKSLESIKLDYTVISPIYKNLYLKELKKKNIKGIFLKRYPSSIFIESLNSFLENLYIEKANPDIVHDTYYSKNLYKNSSFKKVITVHDLIYENFSNYFSYKIKEKLKDKKLAVENSDFIICVSNTTKKQLLDIYNIDEKKVKVIYHGADHLDDIVLDNINLKIEKDFILFVGARSKYKNFSFLLEAYSRMGKIKNDLNLICFGGGDFTKEENETIGKLNIEENVKIFPNNNDTTLKYLYKNAKVLVIPSETEGFGLPILEGMRNKCNIIASDIEIFKEIGKDKIHYFENGNIDSLINELEKKIYSENKNLIIEALEYSKNFTWLSCAKKTFEIYSEIK